MPVPPISFASTDRLGRAAECADAMVDDGIAPADALAKAAREEALPYGHVPILVRAFNTGRAARQLAETDPWAKAADHPVTTADAVYTALGKLDEPVVEKSSSDYSRPPYVPEVRPQEPAPKTVPTAIPDAFTVKRAAAPQRPEPNRNLTVQIEVARLMDAIRDRAMELPAATYAGVKSAAAHAYPRAADAFDFIEKRNHFVAIKAAAAPDPLVSTRHPIVVLVGQLDAAIAGYRPEPSHELPVGATKIAEDCDRVWYAVPDPNTVKSAGDGSINVKAPEPFRLDVRVPGADDIKKKAADGIAPAPPPRPPSPSPSPSIGNKLTGIPGVSGAWKGFSGTLGLAFNNPIGRRAVDAMTIDDSKTDGYVDPKIDTQVGKLKADLGRIDQQSALQDIIADPRLARADPKTVIQTYQMLSRLAPEAMSNPSVAADFVHRQIHTGPPTLFDLKQLTDIEKSLAQIKDYRARASAEEEES